MAKSPDAFRTISEVADWLGVEAHVLRFWETKFTQVKPVKRAGGRRYYRPNDMALLGGIRRLLHDEGMTIRGVQKVLREKGVGHVAGMAPERELDAAAPARPEQAPRRPAAAPRVPVATADDAPTLPFDLPRGVAPEPEPELEAAPSGMPANHGGSAAPVVPERLRAHAARLDPAATADVLARARALVERLRTTPE